MRKTHKPRAPELSASAQPGKGCADARLKIPRRATYMACDKRPQWPRATACHPYFLRLRARERNALVRG